LGRAEQFNLDLLVQVFGLGALKIWKFWKVFLNWVFIEAMFAFGTSVSMFEIMPGSSFS
jgi:hypothetical protein